MFEEIKEDIIKTPNQQFSINRNSGIDEDLLKTPEGKPSPFISNTGGSSGDLGQYSSAGLLDKLGGDVEQSEEKQYRSISYSEMMKYYSPKWLSYAGFLACVLGSLSLPLFGFVLSRYIFLLAKFDSPQDYPDTIYFYRNVWTGIFVAVCVGIGVNTYFQKLCFGKGGENLTFTLRIRLFQAYLSKHIGWYDKKQHAPAYLSNIISEDIQ